MVGLVNATIDTPLPTIDRIGYDRIRHYLHDLLKPLQHCAALMALLDRAFRDSSDDGERDLAELVQALRELAGRADEANRLRLRMLDEMGDGEQLLIAPLDTGIVRSLDEAGRYAVMGTDALRCLAASGGLGQTARRLQEESRLLNRYSQNLLARLG